MDSDEIFIYGTGRIAGVIGVGLSSIDPPPPVTFIFSSRDLLESYYNDDNIVTVSTTLEHRRQVFEQQIPSVYRYPGYESATRRPTHIHNLIMAVSQTHMRQSLAAIKDCTSRNTKVVLVVSSEIGSAMAAAQQTWPDERHRPQIFIAHSSHAISYAVSSRRESRWSFDLTPGQLRIANMIRANRPHNYGDAMESDMIVAFHDSLILNAELCSLEELLRTTVGR